VSRRPSALERRRRQARVVAIVIALAMVSLIALPLLSFADEASGDLDPTTAASRPVPPEVPAALGPGTGPARAVWLWSTAYLSGATDAAEPDATVLSHADQWVAPVLSGDRATGTRTVWRDPAQDDAVVPATTSDDAPLGQAVADLAADEVLVLDRGEWFAVVDGSVRSLVADEEATLPVPVPLAEHQVERTAQYADDLAQADTSVGGGSDAGDPRGPDGDQTGAGATRGLVGAAMGVGLVAAVAVVLRQRSRRVGGGR
jgi:hypothetical protein